MPSLAEKLPIFVEPVALSIMLVYVFGLISRSRHNGQLRQIFMGITFGLTAAYSMTNPIEFSDGYIFDLRNLFVGVAIALFGWVSGIIALAMGIVARIAIGGEGALLGIMAMVFAAFMGLTWRWRVNKGDFKSEQGLFLLGLMISGHLSIILFLPQAMRMQVLTDHAPYLAAMNILGSFVIGRLISREEMIIAKSSELEKAAKTDPLTNLMNRRTLIDTVSCLPENKTNHLGCAVVYLDVDHFKQVNDTFGHLNGDRVLKSIVGRVRNQLRPNDLFARLGGDEFAVVLPNISEEASRATAQRFCECVSSNPVQIDGEGIEVTLSVGVYWSKQTAALESSLMCADAELYQSKSMGRNQVSFRTDECPDAPANESMPISQSISA